MGWFSRKKKAKPAAQGDSFQNNNPYSQETTSSRPDAYDPKPSGGYGGMGGLPPPAYEPGNATLSAGGLRRDNPPQFRDEKSPVPPGGYGRGGGTDSGHFTGAGSYADQQGYGSERYGRDSHTAQPQYQRSGGYGGMGSLNDDNSQVPSRPGPHNKDLFGNAAQRAAPQPAPSSYRHVGSSDSRDSRPPPTHGKDALLGNAVDRHQQVHGNSAYSSPGNYNDAPSTGHDNASNSGHIEDEEAFITATKAESKAVQSESRQAINRTNAIVEATKKTAYHSASTLQEQGESLYHINREMKAANAHARTAGEKVKEVGKLHKNAFWQPVSQGKEHAVKQDAEEMDRWKADYQENIASRQDNYKQNKEYEQQKARLHRDTAPIKSQRTTHTMKYDIEDDPDWAEGEEDIESGMANTLSGVKDLKDVALFMGRSIDQQSKLIDQIGGRADVTAEELQGNQRRLDKIK